MRRAILPLLAALCIVALVTSIIPAAAAETPNAGWEQVGAGSASDAGISQNDGGSSAPSAAVAPDGTLYVAWHDDSSTDGDEEIYVRSWDGASWEEVGAGSATGEGISDNAGV